MQTIKKEHIETHPKERYKVDRLTVAELKQQPETTKELNNVLKDLPTECQNIMSDLIGIHIMYDTEIINTDTSIIALHLFSQFQQLTIIDEDNQHLTISSLNDIYDNMYNLVADTLELTGLTMTVSDLELPPLIRLINCDLSKGVSI